jgi:hypothetical protein
MRKLHHLVVGVYKRAAHLIHLVLSVRRKSREEHRNYQYSCPFD